MMELLQLVRDLPPELDAPDLSRFETDSDRRAHRYPAALQRAVDCGLVLPGIRRSEDMPYGVILLLASGRQFLDRGGEVSPWVLRMLPGYLEDLDAREALFFSLSALLADFRRMMRRGAGAHFIRHELLPERWRTMVIDDDLTFRFYEATAATCAQLAADEFPDHMAGDLVLMRLVGRALRTLTLAEIHGVRSEEEVAWAKAALGDVFSVVSSVDLARVVIDEDLDGMMTAGFLSQLDPELTRPTVADATPPSDPSLWFAPFALARPIMDTDPAAAGPHGLVDAVRRAEQAAGR